MYKVIFLVTQEVKKFGEKTSSLNHFINVIEPSNELSQNKFFHLLTPSMRTSNIQRGGHAAMKFKYGQQGLEQGSTKGYWTLRSTFAR